MSDTTNRYPRDVVCGGTPLRLALMAARDQDAILAFARALPKHDLLFMRRDISHPKVVAAWGQAIAAGQIASLIAWSDSTVVGCAAIVRDELSWSSHVGELRVIVSPAIRGHGLGRVLIAESMALAIEMGLRKIVTQMTTDQVAAISVFESFGFSGEALLRDQVIDSAGAPHDIALLSHDVARVQAQRDAYGDPAEA